MSRIQYAPAINPTSHHMHQTAYTFPNESISAESSRWHQPSINLCNCKFLRDIFHLIFCLCYQLRRIRYGRNDHHRRFYRKDTLPSKSSPKFLFSGSKWKPSASAIHNHLPGLLRTYDSARGNKRKKQTKRTITANAPTTVTWYPFSLRRLAMCDPMKPAPPPTQTLAPSPGGNVKGLWSGIFYCVVCDFLPVLS